MGEILGYAIPMIAVMGALSGVIAFIVRWVIIKPLQGTITTLTKSVEELEKTLSILSAETKDIDRRLTRVEESSKSAHHRVDEHEKRIHDLEVGLT